MRKATPILAIGFLLTCASTRAQNETAEAYFNQASKEYVKQEKIEALRTLDAGLKQFPGDARMLRLAEELLKEQEQQPQKEQEQDEQNGENGKNEQHGGKGSPEQQAKEQEKQDQQQGGDTAQEKPRNPQQNPGAIAPQDALRMLDALERSELDVQDRVRQKRRPAVRRTIEKDW